MVFNFDKPETTDFTDTVRLLAGMSHFVIGASRRPHPEEARSAVSKGGHRQGAVAHQRGSYSALIETRQSAGITPRDAGRSSG
jgi:hypothetical protein